MKKTGYIIIALMCMMRGVMSQVDTHSNLVLCMPMNSNANDLSGNLNNGVTHGATLTADRFGTANSAYHFNGTNSYIQVMGSHSLDSIEHKNELTVTVWASINNWYQGWNVFNFVNKYNTSTDYGWDFELQNPNATGQGMLFVGNYPQNGIYYNTVTSAFHHWDFYAITYSKSHQTCKMYKNGILVSTAPNASLGLEGTNNGPLFIGFSEAGPDEYSDGDIDDVRMYSRALTDNEVMAVYNGASCDCPSISVNSPTICTGGQAILTATGSSTTYTWSTGAANTPSISISPSASSGYTVTSAMSTCTVQAIAQVSVLNTSAPSISIDLSDSCHGNVHFIDLNHSLSNSWFFSNGTIKTGTDDFSDQYQVAGTYTVLLVTNPNTSCADTASQVFQVNVTKKTSVSFPNVITPNNDGVNDRFDFSAYIACGDFQFEVFDRWGLSQVRSATGGRTFWDGHNSGGTPVKEGTYFYMLKAGKESYNGTISVFR